MAPFPSKDQGVLTTSAIQAETLQKQHLEETSFGLFLPHPPNLLTVNNDIFRHLLHFLPAADVARLGSTCRTTHTSVFGQFIPCLDIPFTEDFLEELRKTKVWSDFLFSVILLIVALFYQVIEKG